MRYGNLKRRMRARHPYPWSRLGLRVRMNIAKQVRIAIVAGAS